MSEPEPEAVLASEPVALPVEPATAVDEQQEQQEQQQEEEEQKDQHQEQTEQTELAAEQADDAEQTGQQTNRSSTSQTQTDANSNDALETADGVAESADAEAEDENGDDEVALVEADDEMPERAEQPVESEETTEADKEIERYNELVKQAGEQQLTLDTGDEEHDNSGHDTSRSTATDAHIAADTVAPTMSSPITKLTTITAAATSAPRTPQSARQPLHISSSAAAIDDELSPRSPGSPSSLSPALRSWADVEAARAECDHLLHINKTRQRHIALILDAERRHNHPSLAVAAAAAQQSAGQQQSDGSGGSNGGSSEPIKTDYIKLLTQLSAMWDDVAQQQSKSESGIARLLDKLNEQDAVGEEMQDSLRAFILEMARSATDKRGNTAHISKYERLLLDEAKVSRQLADVRLLYLQQQGQMDTIQQLIKQKEELAEGLHLIDFEQLKIENATLHEKIEERNDEIYKLTKKKHNCIEVLTHVREKVWYVWHENQLLHSSTTELDDAILGKRRILKGLKAQREVLRKQNALLKTKEGFVGVDALVMDYEKRKELVNALKEQIEAKRIKWEQLTRAKERRASAGSERARQPNRGEKGGEEKEQTMSWAQQTRVATHRFSR